MIRWKLKDIHFFSKRKYVIKESIVARQNSSKVLHFTRAGLKPG